jgi:hypothetical protein
MKKQILLAAIAFFLSMGTLFAQAPNLFNYQGVARDASGQALSGKAISLRIIIRTGSSTGTLQYRETHNVTTNSYGLYNVAVGNGTNKTNTLAGVTWGNGAKYMQVQIDPNGGTSWTTVGTTQLLSAPYALYAKEVAPKAVVAFETNQVASNTFTSTPIFTNEVFDEGSNFNTTTGEFTAPEDGIYHFDCSINCLGISSVATSSFVSLGFFVNTSVKGMRASFPSSYGNWHLSSSITVKLSAGDKVKPRIFKGISQTFSFGGGDPAYNHFSGFKVN